MINVTTDKRYNICQKHREYLYLIYYLGNKLLTAVQLYNFALKTNSYLSKSRFERDLKALEDSNIIRTELIYLNGSPSRLRVLYLRKYAVAYVENAETTVGINNINFSRITPEIILKHVTRADVLFGHLKHINYQSILEAIRILKLNRSTYTTKKNQSHVYMIDLYNFLIKLDDVDNDYLEWEFKKSEELSLVLEQGRSKGSQSSINNSTTKITFGNQENVPELRMLIDDICIDEPNKTPKKIMQERIDNYSLTTMLHIFDIYHLRTKEQKIIFNLHMTITKKTSFWRIMSDIIGVYRYFSNFFTNTMNVFVHYKVFFTDKLASDRFKKRYALKASDYFATANISFMENLIVKVVCIDMQTKYKDIT